MRRLILIALLGSLAQLVDGTLGMAYGVTATTALLITGITPAVASASVHLAEVGTTLASGVWTEHPSAPLLVVSNPRKR